MWYQDGEFLPSKPSHYVGTSIRNSIENFSNSPQTLVSLHVPVMVVIGFEKIDVDHDKCEGGLGAKCAVPFVFQTLIEHATVGDFGESVDIGIAFQFQIKISHLHFSQFQTRDIASTYRDTTISLASTRD